MTAYDDTMTRSTRQLDLEEASEFTTYFLLLITFTAQTETYFLSSTGTGMPVCRTGMVCWCNECMVRVVRVTEGR